MSANRRPITIDIGFIFAVLIIIFAISYVELPLKESSIMISAIEGITTVTGLLFAVDGILLTRFYSDKVSPIQKIRADFYVLALAVSSVFIGGAYLSFLAFDAPVLGLKISLIVFNISYAVAIALVFHFIYFFDLPNCSKV
jgi:hypothetical protein